MVYRMDMQALPELIECQKFTRNTTWRCADKRNILIYVVEGRVEFRMNGETYFLGAGDFLLIPAETPYVRCPADEASYTFFSSHFVTKEPIEILSNTEFEAEMERVRGELLRRHYEGKFGPDASEAEECAQKVYLSPVVNAGKNTERAVQILDRICREELTRMYFYSRLGAALSFSELLVMLSTEVISGSASSVERSRELPATLSQLLYYIQKNYKKPLTVGELAAVAKVTEQHVIRLFRQHLGTTPIRYINRTRVFHAIDLLRNTDLTVKQIAYEIGFEDPNYFCRVFKREEKMTPLETRRRIANYERDRIASPVKE